MLLTKSWASLPNLNVFKFEEKNYYYYLSVWIKKYPLRRDFFISVNQVQNDSIQMTSTNRKKRMPSTFSFRCLMEINKYSMILKLDMMHQVKPLFYTKTWLSRNKMTNLDYIRKCTHKTSKLLLNSKESKISGDHQLACKSDFVTLTHSIFNLNKKHDIIGLHSTIKDSTTFHGITELCLLHGICSIMLVSFLWNVHTEH